MKFLTGLFDAPFAILTEDQRQRVADWCPTELATPVAPELSVGVSDAGAESEGDCATDEDDAGEADDEPTEDDLQTA